MEKISQIVRPNARMASADLPKAGAVRPGAPSFGRPTGESRGGGVREVTTADRAAQAASDLADQRRPSETQIIDQLARDFFLTKNDPIGPAAGPVADVIANAGPPSGFVPRGSFVDVRA